MTISRRNLFKAGIAVGTALSFPPVLRAQTSPSADRTVHMVKGDLTIFDPVVTTSNLTLDHALAIYDTLFSNDSTFVPQPQMVGKWGVSDDKKTYTFELRDGLGWHDGASVTAADCVASIHRWGEVKPGGQLLMTRASDISKKDERTFKIVLKEPLGLLPTILTQDLYVMREKDASTPATDPVNANIGSGPFVFNHALAKPGVSVVYDRNEKYVPRSESSDGFAGGKIAKVDRIIWDVIADQQTALAALQAGEIDYLEAPPADLYPVIDSDPNLALQVLNASGWAYFLRMNCLQKPFDNVKMRQAVLHLVDQEAFLQVISPGPQFASTVKSFFGGGNLVSNDENTGWFKKGGNPEKAKQLLSEAGYTGEKVIILQPTDWAEASNTSQVLASELRKIGVNAELAAMDWGTLVTRRANKGPVNEGGWSIFITSESDFSRGDPIGTADLSMNGEKGYFGWPSSDEYEVLRAKWAVVQTMEERKTLAGKMQQIAWDLVPEVLLGRVVAPIARRQTLNGLIGMPDYVPMWNMQKASA
ncbi:ABC transporter substrate-binding protein [Mesorhizobium sp. C416B]|uniref:ABC transporter substrate-binding protein n=1 Tax=unclassified Mesorhizobium TaxID=325217 RepID=UPI0003CF2933|nr:MULTISPECIES: ABC transporter substrate-binding protein [unclassified Mesorhizobium]ESX50617.1 peptide ABC transporter substrate-binding protein [Mesorhizobium sp. LSHC422A00]WJI65550.1 ABC transporter substrate-binding protein [Mesorhizobium sp. C416B]